MDAKAIANAAYVLERAEKKLTALAEAAKTSVDAAVEKARKAATEKYDAKLKAATTKVAEAKATLTKLTTATPAAKV